jgi:hypothetical protein
MGKIVLKTFALLFVLFAFAGCKSHKQLTAGQQAAANKVPGVIIDTDKPIQTVALPIFIPITELQSQLYTLFFAPNDGKYYPCKDNPDCTDSYKDLYIESPVIHVKDSMITIKMHLGGTAHMLLDFSVSGDMLLTAKPEVKNDTLYFRNVTLQPSSQNLITGLTTSLFGKQITSKIQEKAWYSFRPKLDETTRDIKQKFPMKWGNICLLLNIHKIYLNKVKTQARPVEGIVAGFAAELTLETGDFCGQ